MAHKKGVGSSDNGRDSKGRRLGVKLFGGQEAISGNIIIRQHGTKFHPGKGVDMGKDYTIYAVTDGRVLFTRKADDKVVVNVIPQQPVAETLDVAAPAPKKAKVSAPEKTQAPVVEDVVEAKPAKAAKADNLKTIEGIGPAIEKILHEGGIVTFADLASSTPESIKELLSAAGERFNVHNPESWPAQAALARDGKMDELKELQEKLDGGRIVED